MDSENLVIDQSFVKWGRAQFDRLPSIRGKLLQDNGVPHPETLWNVDAAARAFLFLGWEEHFKKLVPRDDVVLSHNDT